MSKLELGRSLSIQSCFPERLSYPNSAETSKYESVEDTSTIQCFGNVREVKIDIDPATANDCQNETAHRPGPFFLPKQPTSFPEIRTKRTKNLIKYVPLYRAALKGDWEKAEKFIGLHPGALTTTISKGWETALHIAAGANQIKFVEELVKVMDTQDLALKNKYENTALCFAAASGITRIAEVMVEKNRKLPAVRGSMGVTPLHMAALLGHRAMVWYLYSVTDHEDLTVEDFTGLLIATISSDLYDVALHILLFRPELAIKRDPNGETALHVLARKPSAFSGKSGLNIWKRCIYRWVPVQLHCVYGYTFNKSKPQNPKITKVSLFLTRLLEHITQITGIKEILQRKFLHGEALNLVDRVWSRVLLLDDTQIGDLLRSPSRPLFVAAEFGNFEFIVKLLRSYPDLIWKVDEKSRSIFHIAVKHRQEKIFKLIYDIGAHKDLITSYKDAKK